MLNQSNFANFVAILGKASVLSEQVDGSRIFSAFRLPVAKMSASSKPDASSSTYRATVSKRRKVQEATHTSAVVMPQFNLNDWKSSSHIRLDSVELPWVTYPGLFAGLLAHYFIFVQFSVL